MCCSSTAAKSPMAQFLKSQSPQELWKASLKPPDPLKAADIADPAKQAGGGPQSVSPAKRPGTGLLIDTTA